MRITNLGALTSMALSLAACGGSGGSGIVSGPPPAPTPSPSPTAVLKPELIAIEPDQSRAIFGLSEVNTMSANFDRKLSGSKDVAHIASSRPGQKTEEVSFLYDRASDRYMMTLPDGTRGELVLKYLNGTAGEFASSTGHSLAGPSGDPGVVVTMPVPFRPGWRYTYSHYGDWNGTKDNADGSARQTWGLFVYGYETPASAVPRSGSARYQGQIIASSPADPWEVGGSVMLDVDFAAGVLGSAMNPIFETNGFYPDLDHDYGRFDFAQTVYSRGSSRYSGAFAKDGVSVAGSWFEGALTGPGAEEAIARFVAPFTRGPTTGALSGIWISKKE
jgi:hypothetical protein